MHGSAASPTVMPCGRSTDPAKCGASAKLNGDLRPGLASLPKGLWARHTQNGQTANALAPDTLSDLAAGACFNDTRVQIERVEAPLAAESTAGGVRR